MSDRRWTPELTEQVRQLFLVEGKSATTVAKKLGGGLTRSMVIGKAAREGWCKGPVPQGATTSFAKVKKVEITATVDRAARWGVKHAPTETSRTLVELGSHTCKWPVGTETDRHQQFCGARAVEGPYCPDHRRRAYQRRAAQ